MNCYTLLKIVMFAALPGVSCSHIPVEITQDIDVKGLWKQTKCHTGSVANVINFCEFDGERYIYWDDKVHYLPQHKYAIVKDSIFFTGKENRIEQKFYDIEVYVGRISKFENSKFELVRVSGDTICFYRTDKNEFYKQVGAEWLSNK